MVTLKQKTNQFESLPGFFNFLSILDMVKATTRMNYQQFQHDVEGIEMLLTNCYKLLPKNIISQVDICVQ